MGIKFDLVPGTEPLFNETDYRIKVLKGSRGSAKSWSVARYLITRACAFPARILCGRELQKSLAESVHKLVADQIALLGLGDYFEIQKEGIFGKNGSQFLFTGIRSNPGGLKSMEGLSYAWLEEAENISEDSWLKLEPTIRAPGSQIIISYNPRFEHDYLHKLLTGPDCPPRTWVKHLNWYDNPWFPEAELGPGRDHMKATNPLLYKHVWLGECVPNLQNALWTREMLDSQRLQPGTEIKFGRVLVSVDPAVTANKRSDETGITVVASSASTPRHFYVLADLSGRLSPEAWARRVLEAVEYYSADGVVVEVNQGGDLVRTNLAAVAGGPLPRIIEVRATRGKILRAEPIAALYEQGLVHHVGNFPLLESQMLTFNPVDTSQPSPDRVDSAVWGLHEMVSGRRPMKISPNFLDRVLSRA